MVGIDAPQKEATLTVSGPPECFSSQAASTEVMEQYFGAFGDVVGVRFISQEKAVVSFHPHSAESAREAMEEKHFIDGSEVNVTKGDASRRLPPPPPKPPMVSSPHGGNEYQGRKRDRSGSPSSGGRDAQRHKAENEGDDKFHEAEENGGAILESEEDADKRLESQAILDTLEQHGVTLDQEAMDVVDRAPPAEACAVLQELLNGCEDVENPSAMVLDALSDKVPPQQESVGNGDEDPPWRGGAKGFKDGKGKGEAGKGGKGGKGAAVEPEKVYVTNMPRQVSDDEVKAHFSHYGNVVKVYLPRDEAGQSRGFAFVDYETAAEATVALQNCDSREMQGRRCEALACGHFGMRGREQTDKERIFVGGLPSGCSREVLEDHFQKFGEVERIEVNPRGFAFVKYRIQSGAQVALQAYNDHVIEGRWVQVKPVTLGAKGEGKGDGKGKDDGKGSYELSKGFGVSSGKADGKGGCGFAWGGTEEAIKDFILHYGLDEYVSQELLSLPPSLQKEVMATADLRWVGNPSEAVMKLLREVGGKGCGGKGKNGGSFAGEDKGPLGVCRTKVFVGGLPRSASEQDIGEYFSWYGKIVRISMRSGFCFVEFVHEDSVRRVLQARNDHFIHEKPVDCQVHANFGLAQGAATRKERIFVGGLRKETANWHHINDYFSAYGVVTEVELRQGYCFVSFESPASAQLALWDWEKHCLDGKWVEVKPVVDNPGSPHAVVPNGAAGQDPWSSHGGGKGPFGHPGASWKGGADEKAGAKGQWKGGCSDWKGGGQYKSEGKGDSEKGKGRIIPAGRVGFPDSVCGEGAPKPPAPPLPPAPGKGKDIFGKGKSDAFKGKGDIGKSGSPKGGKDDRVVEPEKLFITGLIRTVTDKEIGDYFREYGHVTDVNLKYDDHGVFKGFGFVTFHSEKQVRSVLKDYDRHAIQGQWFECKACGKFGTKQMGPVAEDKISVGNVVPGMTPANIEAHFSRFGRVVHVEMKAGSAIVTFGSGADVQLALQAYNEHYINGKWVEARPCPAAGGKGSDGTGDYGQAGKASGGQNWAQHPPPPPGIRSRPY
eukprot:TRINITY_DN67072_c0_g1_i1.p1 TRINITY_DN67072_c0_g1~~TRINITY_DN67072_c0_g1_i1.p1  ORF type:complete len:1057 (-),score=245.52 TRINITY_DN67072_c0_g1_i1:82-3252(-)